MTTNPQDRNKTQQGGQPQKPRQDQPGSKPSTDRNETTRDSERR